MTTTKGVSIVVCCYNSEQRLADTIKHVALQKVTDHVKWELVIVNNASTDFTYETAIKVCESYPQLTNKYKVINQPIPGLSFARELGIATSQYKYIIFCDDDNWLAENYLALSFDIMESNPKIGALGGQSTATTEKSNFPDWFDAVKGSYAVGKQMTQNGYTNKNIWGAGMVIRKQLHQKCFPSEYPSYLTGRNGTKLSAGEDTEFCLRLQLKNYRMYYDERLSFIHFISGNRLSKTYYKNMSLGFTEALIKLFDLIQLVDWKNASFFEKALIMVKKIFGYIISLTGRKSWELKDLKVMLYYLTKIDTGVADETKKIYKFYKDYHFKIDE